mmetsp:Transcript_32815/g.81283  ORF Transcript_32815/g.81283 Transcript_32815/m.81283 type:complete len:94 (+) Transcript_32815:125-406(+)
MDALWLWRLMSWIWLMERRLAFDLTQLSFTQQDLDDAFFGFIDWLARSSELPWMCFLASCVRHGPFISSCVKDMLRERDRETWREGHVAGSTE